MGIVLQYLSLVAVLVLVAHIAIQIWCILYEEEELLRRTFPEYADYQRSSWRLIPFVW